MVDGNSIIHMADCFKCGCKVKIKIDRTPGGFGLLGGISYQSELNKLYAECLDCQKSPNAMPDPNPQGSLSTLIIIRNYFLHLEIDSHVLIEIIRQQLDK
jgi:hypothetical protein